MRWTAGGRSADLIDARGGGGRGRVGLPIGKLGIGGTLVLALLGLFFGRNFLGSSGDDAAPVAVSDASEEKQVEFISFVLDDNQKTWERILQPQTGVPYRRAKLVLFRDGVQSQCGFAESAVGPFYCPPDEKVFIDLSFYDALSRKLGAPGDFAQAYVLAHEIGHHVQNVLGIDDEMRAAQRGKSKGAQNDLSIRMELQADCFAGIWAKSTQQRDLLEKGDVEEAMNAAAAVGDDTLQKAGSGHVSPEKWTHGSSAMRVRWFNRGMQSGAIKTCDTFAADDL